MRSYAARGATRRMLASGAMMSPIPSSSASAAGHSGDVNASHASANADDGGDRRVPLKTPVAYVRSIVNGEAVRYHVTTYDPAAGTTGADAATRAPSAADGGDGDVAYLFADTADHNVISHSAAAHPRFPADGRQQPQQPIVYSYGLEAALATFRNDERRRERNATAISGGGGGGGRSLLLLLLPTVVTSSNTRISTSMLRRLSGLLRCASLA